MLRLNKIVRSELYIIEEHINERITTTNNLSLMTGKGGGLLFYESLFKLTGNSKYLAKTEKLLEDMFNVFNNIQYDGNFSFCNGLSGIAYSFHILSKSNSIWKNELSDTLLVFDKLILEYTLSNTRTINDIDFLHGSLGAIFYLNNRIETSLATKMGTERLFETTSLIVREHILSLNSLDKAQAIEIYGFGLAHGYASLIIVLSKALSNNKQNESLRKTIVILTNYLLEFKNNNSNNLSVFPSNIYGKIGYDNPLSWCRGDQGIAYSFFKASEVLNSSYLLNEAKEIADRTLKRDSLEKSVYSVENCSLGFCHGISSIAYLHKKSFSFTGEHLFLRQYNMLLNRLLQRKGDYSPFEDLDEVNKLNTAPDMTLLNGLTGIGLFYIDFLNKTELPIWEGVFLLD